jgi:hypothetical protein
MVLKARTLKILVLDVFFFIKTVVLDANLKHNSILDLKCNNASSKFINPNVDVF